MNPRCSGTLSALFVGYFLAALSTQGADPWQTCATGLPVSLRGIAALTESEAWVSGAQGTALRTEDAGATWIDCRIDQWRDADFRSIVAWDSQHALVVSAGQPCVICRTEDGGSTWSTTYRNEDPASFLDGVKFWSPREGLAFGDPIDGKLWVLRTDDGGLHWHPASDTPLEMKPGEAAFAASNGSLLLGSPGYAWIGLGGHSGPAEILVTQDRGACWSRVAAAPVPRDETAGIFSLATNGEGTIVAVGGDFRQPNAPNGNIALSQDSGKTWRLPTGPSPRGYRSSVVYTASGKGRWITVGPSGSDGSQDAETWQALSDTGFHALSVSPSGDVWACGSEGRVATLTPDG